MAELGLAGLVPFQQVWLLAGRQDPLRGRDFLAAPMTLVATPSNPFGVKALTFDVFGTVVDWRGSIIREGTQWRKARGLRLDWAKFADRWRAGYGPSMDLLCRCL